MGGSEIGDIVTASFVEIAEDGSEIPGTSPGLLFRTRQKFEHL